MAHIVSHFKRLLARRSVGRDLALQDRNRGIVVDSKEERNRVAFFPSQVYHTVNGGLELVVGPRRQRSAFAWMQGLST